MGITLRSTKGEELSHNELDTNFSELYASSSVSGNTITLFSDGSGSFQTISHSVAVDTGSTLTLYSESGSQATITGSLVVSGDITAEQFHTEIQSASIVYTSGSTKFGDSLDDNHAFTGSLQTSGSFAVSGSSVLEATGSNSLKVEAGYVVLTEVSESLNFVSDASASQAGVPLGGLYRNGNVVYIRLT